MTQPAIIYQHDKRSDITYAYESVSWWDKSLKQSRAKRKLIGVLDKTTGQIVATKKRKLDQINSSPNNCDNDTDKFFNQVLKIKRQFCGATYLFDEIAKNIGLTEDLKTCFPKTWDQMLSIAYYLILEPKNPLYLFKKWHNLHRHPFGEEIASQRSSELFINMDEDQRMRFFILQSKRRLENEYWAYDTTSISSYSKCLEQVRYGKNKENDLLPQINLLLLFGEQSNLPFYYRKLPGNIPDVITIKNLIADIDFFKLKKVKLVMDRGFYSEKNVNALYEKHIKFLLGTKISLKFVQRELSLLKEDFKSIENVIPKYSLFGKSVSIIWKYLQKRPYKGDVNSEARRMYLHIYFDSAKYYEEETSLYIKLKNFEEEILSNKRQKKNEKEYSKYFIITTTPVRGIKVEQKINVIKEELSNYGYFVLISNEIKDPVQALELYRNKDVIEKAFGNLKERLNFRRALVSSDSSLDGKIFLEFIALIILSYIKRQMEIGDLFKKYTMQELLYTIDYIECFQRPGKKILYSETTTEQLEIFEAMKVDPIPSLC